MADGEESRERRVGDLKRAAIEDEVGGGVAEIVRCANTQGAGGERGRAGIIIGATEGEHAATGFDESGGAAEVGADGGIRIGQPSVAILYDKDERTDLKRSKSDLFCINTSLAMSMQRRTRRARRIA